MSVLHHGYAIIVVMVVEQYAPEQPYGAYMPVLATVTYCSATSMK